MFSKRVRNYTIDLDEDEYRRWEQVIEADKKVVARLVEEAEEDYAGFPGFVKRLLGKIVTAGYKASGGRYQDELQAWADALERPVGDITLANCAYELSHVGSLFLEATAVFGCTTGVRWVPELGMVHVRNLDWAMTGIGRATRIFKFRKGRREFTTVGIPGYVGVLSGMLPGAYSVTINWAPPNGRPHFNFGPAFLLREVLETCDGYEEAVEILTNTPLSTSVFFTVCGVKRGQACVIERTREDAAIRKFRSPVLVQANHFVSNEFSDINTDRGLLDFSKKRTRILKRTLRKRAIGLEEVASCLDTESVLNEDTQQKMIFCPKTGKMRVWRCTG